MTHFSIVLENPDAVRDLSIRYAKVAMATGDNMGYEFFNILRERVEEAQYGLTMKAREAEEGDPALESLGSLDKWRSPKHFERYGVDREGRVFDFHEQQLLEKEPVYSVMQYKMVNEFGTDDWFTSETLLEMIWPEVVKDR